MSKNFDRNLSPILVVDDDQDDIDFVQEAVERLNLQRPVHYFKSGEQLIDFLLEGSVEPFLILSDVNLYGKSGFAVKNQLFETPNLRYKSIPFIFWSTSASEVQIQEAYDLQVQGFFYKSADFDDFCLAFKMIVDYWERSLHPKKVR